jgi:hypothetical protein
MKKKNKFWLPLALLFTAASLIGPAACDTSTNPKTETPAPEVPVPDRTTVKYGSTTVFSGYATAVPESAPLKVWMIDWKNEWQGHANEFVITVGKDIINANKDRIDLMMLRAASEAPTPTSISQAEREILLNKLRAGAPNKTINAGTLGEGLTLVESY